jgi:hypothetical protein
MAAAHHRANVLFNIMRGGVFVDGTRFDRDDLLCLSAPAQPAPWPHAATCTAEHRLATLQLRPDEAHGPGATRWARRPNAWCWNTCR